MGSRKLKPEELRKVCDPSVFPFKTTEDYIFEYEPVHQERGVGSIDFGLNVKSDGYNIFVCGSAGTGRNTQVKKAVYQLAAQEKTPGDWIYVYNFIHEDEPAAITLPAGMGRVFKKDMEEMVDDLRAEIPKAFVSEDYEKRKHDLLGEYKQKRETSLQEIEDRAFKQGFVLKQTATGVILVSRIGDKPMEAEAYERLSSAEKKKIEKTKSKLHVKIEQVLSEVRALEKEAKNRIKDLEKEIALFSVRHMIDELRARYNESEDIIRHLNRVQENILTNIDIFKEEEETGVVPLLGVKGAVKENAFKKYEVNLLIDHSHSEGAPVIIEPNPTYYNLLGRIEYVAHFGSMTTDFTMIAPGALHKANGGYLILQAMDVLSAFMAWEALKRVIRNRQIKVEDINEQFRLISTTSLKPEPIPCDIKIIMVGPLWLHQLLYRFDENFRKMFKVKADFDTEMSKDPEKIKKYAAFIKVRCDSEGLRHFDRKAVARIVEYGSRVADDKDKLSARFVYIADILREANYWAGKDHAQYVRVKHIRKAIEEKVYRSNLIEGKIAELIEKNVLMIDADGTETGQINGLAVYDMGEYMFGKPSRITARTFMGKKGVVDIERQVKMGGKIHSKGMMILGGYLGGKFGQERPLSLSASICFEQSYEGVDGDSASSTEAYCLLSALSGIPLKQSIAVTGSMNQHGKVQPVGGINEKIEGFYRVCKTKGLTGRQGVMMPALNVRHLMLKEEVIEAVKDGRFHIWMVSTIEEGIEILTGKKAGIRGKNGKYPPGTVNYLVNKKLREYSERLSETKKPGSKGKKARRK
ncbi:MAG: AAA family ATPase [Candidatus Omnitrophica bacterium]|nr:AAA family ATPase [Candidatus Omnitrophota bacterium]